MALHYKQPKYYDKFKCIGGKCTVSCCERWSIDWYGHEIKKVKDANPSDELKELLEKSFKEKLDTFNFSDLRTDEEKRYSIILKENGNCPFHNEEGLCMIQKELGEEYLSETCTIYPRKHFIHKENIIRSCYNSCPAVLDLLSEDINAVRLESQYTESDFHYRLSSDGDKLKRLENYPVLNYRMELMEFYNKLITDRNVSLETAIVLGALASKRFTDAVENNKIDEIPALIKEYEEKLKDKATIKAIEEIKPNYLVQFKFVNNLLVTFLENADIQINISNLHDGEKLIPENYARGIANLNDTFKGREYFFKNVAANMLFDFNMPFRIQECSILENYTYYALAVASLKVIGVSVAEKGVDVEKKYKNAISMMGRAFAHNKTRTKNVIEYLKEHGFTSAAHVALLIK
ncbi:MAG: flagellin lysine-N-methylase [Ruminiclostridium sp.]|nr:flagellin lysine-N-methylase [Ruminiclostridium sp.]